MSITVHVWLDFAYYDGLLAFAQGCATVEGVKWCGVELPRVEESVAGDTE